MHVIRRCAPCSITTILRENGTLNCQITVVLVKCILYNTVSIPSPSPTGFLQKSLSIKGVHEIPVNCLAFIILLHYLICFAVTEAII